MPIVPIQVDESELADITKALKLALRQWRGEGVHDTPSGVSISRPRNNGGGGNGVLQMWLGIISSPPEGEDEYEDNRYWIELRREIAMPAQRGKEEDVSTFQIADSFVTPDEADDIRRVTAQNLFEHGNNTKSQTLGKGMLIIVWQVEQSNDLSDELVPTTEGDPAFVHWFFQTIPEASTFEALAVVATGSTFGTDAADAAITYDIKNIDGVVTMAEGLTPARRRFPLTTYEVNGTSDIGEQSPCLVSRRQDGTITLLEVYGEKEAAAVCDP